MRTAIPTRPNKWCQGTIALSCNLPTSVHHTSKPIYPINWV